MEESRRGRNKFVQQVAAVLVIWALLAAGTHVYLSRPRNDLFPRWYGARDMLRGHDPYAYTITPDLVESKGYSDYMIPRDFHFLYPAPITYLLLPFWLLPFPLSLSTWASLQLVIAVLLPIPIFRALGWRPSPRQLAGIMLLSTFGFFHTSSVYHLGQFTLFTMAAIVIAWLQLEAGRDWAAAVALLFPTIRPEGIVIVAVLLGVLLLHRRWRVLLIWGACMSVLVLIAVLQIGFWPDDFIDGIRFYREIAEADAPSEATGLPVLTLLGTLCVVVWGGWMLWQVIRLRTPGAFLWSAMVIIIAELLIVPQTNGYTIAYLLFPLWVLWALDPGNRAHYTRLTLIMLLPWAFLIARLMLDDKLANVEATVLPLLTGVMLTVQWRRSAHQRRTQSCPMRR